MLADNAEAYTTVLKIWQVEASFEQANDGGGPDGLACGLSV
jgi:hypothetical protein